MTDTAAVRESDTGDMSASDGNTTVLRLAPDLQIVYAHEFVGTGTSVTTPIPASTRPADLVKRVFDIGVAGRSAGSLGAGLDRRVRRDRGHTGRPGSVLAGAHRPRWPDVPVLEVSHHAG